MSLAVFAFSPLLLFLSRSTVRHEDVPFADFDIPETESDVVVKHDSMLERRRKSKIIQTTGTGLGSPMPDSDSD